MAFGEETHDGPPNYEVILEYPLTGMQARVAVFPMYGSYIPSGDAAIDEADRDALFQAVLTAMNNLGVMTILSAVKRGNFISDVTP